MASSWLNTFALHIISPNYSRLAGEVPLFPISAGAHDNHAWAIRSVMETIKDN